MRVSRSRATKQALSILLLVATLSVGQLPPQVVEFQRAFMMDVAAAPSAPLNYAAGAVGRLLAMAGTSGKSNAELEKQVIDLTTVLAATQAELSRAREVMSTYEEFRYVTGRAPIFVWDAALNGYIVGFDPDVFSRSYVVSVGSGDGVSKGLPVVHGGVAIGVISEVGIWHSRVRVLADPRSRVCIRFARSGREAVLAGTGRNTCLVRFVPNQVDESEIQPGDFVVTSGTDGVFPPDLLVGRVARFYRRPAEPAADVEVELVAQLQLVQNCLVLKRSAGPGGR
jgi:rod shape-determining protein MreC